MAASQDDILRPWQESLVVLPANFEGLRTFRQFSLTGDPMKPWLEKSFPDDFRLKSMTRNYIWRPRDNMALCRGTIASHTTPSKDCTCGFYGSYSSQIVYQPLHLPNTMYCFAVIRQYGNVIMAENGLRSGGADVEGLLFHPENRHNRQVLRFWNRLEKEGIYYTTSAREFIRRFPDQSYQDILKFDPLKRQADKIRTVHNRTTRSGTSLHTVQDSMFFCRPVRPEMMIERHVIDSSTRTVELSIKPEYRPGGRLYRHPLLEAWLA